MHGANPYVLPPSASPHDAAYRYAGAAWHGTTSAYGPAFKTLAALAVLVLTALVLAAADRGRLASVAWAASIFVKWVTLLLLPLHLLAERASGRPIHRRALLASLVGGALIANAAFGPAWLRAATPLAHVIDQGSRSRRGSCCSPPRTSSPGT